MIPEAFPIEAFERHCPEDCEVFITSVRTIEDLRPGDLVVQYRPDNGHRGSLRVRAAVVVARYDPKEES